jgi:hypothetical protein
MKTDSRALPILDETTKLSKNCRRGSLQVYIVDNIPKAMTSR